MIRARKQKNMRPPIAQKEPCAFSCFKRLDDGKQHSIVWSKDGGHETMWVDNKRVDPKDYAQYFSAGRIM